MRVAGKLTILPDQPLPGQDSRQSTWKAETAPDSICKPFTLKEILVTSGPLGKLARCIVSLQPVCYTRPKCRPASKSLESRLLLQARSLIDLGFCVNPGIGPRKRSLLQISVSNIAACTLNAG